MSSFTFIYATFSVCGTGERGWSSRLRDGSKRWWSAPCLGRGSALMARPRRRHRHPGHPGHHRRRCCCRCRRQNVVGTATGHHWQSRWRSSADEWYPFNGELSCTWMAVSAVLPLITTLAAGAAVNRLLAVGLWHPSFKRSASTPSHLLTARLSRSQTPCSSSTSSKASFGPWFALGRLSRSIE